MLSGGGVTIPDRSNDLGDIIDVVFAR